MITTRDKRVVLNAQERQKALARLKQDNRRRIRPHRPLSDVLADGAWRGQRCFIIAGGPSLAGFDFERLRDEKVIAINRAFEYVPWADILFFMDNRFYKYVHSEAFGAKALKTWNEFEGFKVFLNLMGRKYDDVYSVRSLGRTGVSPSIAKGLFHGNNSGVGALNLAVTLKASPIYLLGYDMKYGTDAKGKKKTHFHSGYRQAHPEGIVRSFIRDIERMNRYLKRINPKIINLNPDSALRCFPFGNIDEVLSNGKTRQGVGDDDPAVRGAVCQSPSA